MTLNTSLIIKIIFSKHSYQKQPEEIKNTNKYDADNFFADNIQSPCSFSIFSFIQHISTLAVCVTVVQRTKTLANKNNTSKYRKHLH